MEDQQIKDILLSEDYVSEEDIAEAEKIATERNISVVTALIDQDVITKNLMGQAVAEHFGVPYVDITKQRIDDDVFQKVPELVARTHRVVALARLKKGIKIGIADPENKAILSLLEKRFDETVLPYFALDTDIESVLQRYKEDIKGAFEEIVAVFKDGIDAGERDQVTTELVDLMLQYGHQSHTSDIHIEPFRKKVLVRFRIDGVLHDVLDIDKNLFEPVLSRIKILAKMRIDEHRAAQDGKLRFTSDEDEVVDVRVSIVPTNTGENVVMRLLSSKSREFQLSSLGMSNNDLERLRKIMKHPHGMLLVTGPTGSGKSTSLYAILKILNKREVHIATIEDPVEYDVEGITQIQVNTKTGLTFAKGLRALVRQDPDIIMVGEIRDEETASIAVNSALTGHLVLSTLHTNDAATALPRLLDMKVEPFLVASTVNAIVAQRLVRKICQSCIVSYPPSDKEKKMLTSDKAMAAYLASIGKKQLKGVNFYKGAGCKVCGNTGYAGRLGIFEILEMTDSVREMVMKNTNADELKKHARGEGMTTMMEDGVTKVLSGLTTLEEVLRVARD